MTRGSSSATARSSCTRAARRGASIRAPSRRTSAGDVLVGEDLRSADHALDRDGQGAPYATYAFGAQMAEVEVDLDLGMVTVRRIVAAHDVGKAINPVQVEGQIHGGRPRALALR